MQLSDLLWPSLLGALDVWCTAVILGSLHHYVGDSLCFSVIKQEVFFLPLILIPVQSRGNASHVLGSVPEPEDIQWTKLVFEVERTVRCFLMIELSSAAALVSLFFLSQSTAIVKSSLSVSVCVSLLVGNHDHCQLSCISCVLPEQQNYTLRYRIDFPNG